jgi:hypothetical protein
MQFVEFRTTDGTKYLVNPTQVRVVMEAEGGKQTTIVFDHNHSFSVNSNAETVAAILGKATTARSGSGRRS